MTEAFADNFELRAFLDFGLLWQFKPGSGFHQIPIEEFLLTIRVNDKSRLGFASSRVCIPDPGGSFDQLADTLANGA